MRHLKPFSALSSGKASVIKEYRMKILLIEDDPHTSDLLSATLSAHRYAVDAIADGSAGLELAAQWSYDLILLDVLLPTLNGIEVCRRLRDQGCQTPILMLTTKSSNQDVITGLDAGADDYVAKTCDSSQLLARVRALLRRAGSAPSSPILTWGLLCLDPALARVTYNQQEIALRPKEYNLLELFLRHPQRILSRSAIIDHLWSMEETPVEGSVTNLIKDLRHRLKSAGMERDLIETVYGLGYRLKPVPKDNSEPEGQGDLAPSYGHAAPAPTPVAEADDDWDLRQQRGITAIQQVTARFRISLERRMAVLETAVQSLEMGNFTVQQRQTACIEAHKLAGGLGTFGYARASEMAQAIEQLLDGQDGQDARLASQLSRLLLELRQALAEPLANRPLADSHMAHH
jgi:DNA-binding response OmpR family regulator/HPt (histidine-containing phosphotransfer) domain-containing protein